MAWELIAFGSFLDATEIATYEGYLPEGAKGAIELDLRLPTPSWLVRELEYLLRQAGVAEVHVSSSGSILRIEYRKGIPWAAVIVAVVLGLIALAILIMGWRFFREVEEFVPEPLKPALGILMLVGLGLLVLSGVKKQLAGART